MKNYLSFISFLLFGTIFILTQNNNAVAQAQPDTVVMSKYEDTLIRYADSMLGAFMPSERATYCLRFIGTLKQSLEQPNSYNYPFKRLSEKIHIISPEDNSFKIFNWVIVASDFQRRYYGAIQMNTPTLKLYPLFDQSNDMEENGEALSQTNHSKWYGCEYYNIRTEVADNTKIYNLFGYNNDAYYSKKKIMEVLTFDENGPIFGLPIIHTPNGTINRLIMEYKKEAYANLNYSTDYKKVIFDRLTSDVGDPSKRYTYVPTGYMDGFEWRNNGWHFIDNAIPIMKLKDGQAPIDGVIPNK